MSSVDYLYIVIASAITAFIEEASYSRLVHNKKIEINTVNIIIFLISGIFITLNTYLNDSLSRIIISFIILLLANILIFKDNLGISFYYMLICYFFVMIYEIVLSMVVMFTDIIDVNSFDTNIWYKSFFSFVNMILVYISCKNSKVRSVSNKIISRFLNIKYSYVVLLILLVSLILIDFKYYITLSKSIYLINVFIVLFLLILIFFILYSYYKINKEIEKSETILLFMSKYEKIIDEDRINRHEMLNNLLFLKSFEDKNTSEYNNILDELINAYDKKGLGIKNIYNIPPGLKGLFYYKIKGLEENGVKLNINVSKKINTSFKKLSKKEYVSIYKIIGILLDNAVEAVLNSKEKYLVIDIYKNKGNIEIIIENSFNGKVNLNKINNKGYSNKGKKRGLGLFIVNKILKDNENIILEQSIDNYIFNSKLIIKKDK